MLKLALLIQVPGRAPYQVLHRARVHEILIPQIMNGDGLPVLVDPDNPKRILLTLADGTPAMQPPRGESGIPTAQPEPTGSAGHVPDQTLSCQARILSIADHYHPTRTTDGDPVFDFELEVRLADQPAPYDVRIAERIPTSLAVTPTPGMVVDVAVDQTDPRAVAIVWDVSAGAPSIGLEGRTISPAWSSQLGVIGGVEIGSVEAGSAAERSGLQTGDVIVKVDELAVSTMNTFAAVIRGRLPGASVVLTVWRAGRETTLTLTLPGRASLGTGLPGVSG